MKKLGIFFFFICIHSFAQKQGNTWYFGDSCGLDFSSGTPAVLTNGNIFTSNGTEGTATICDSEGHLLFYANGKTAWNKNHAVMPDGDGLMGGASSTQGAFIIPRPGSSTLFYLFTTDEFQHDLINGLRYSVIDMCLDSGLGDVATGQKNRLLLDTVAEKMAGTNHANGTDVWLVTHKYYSDAFYAFRISSSGITDTVITHIGSYEPNTLAVGAAIGQLKISPDGSRLALVYSNTFPAVAELYRFNNSTGVVSDPISLPTSGSEYGVSFSPGNSKLYISTLGTSSVFQYDLAAGPAAAVIASQTLIFHNTYPMAGMQLANNGKIYLVDDTWMDVINDPDAAGTACNYTSHAIVLGHHAFYGITNFIDSYGYRNGVPDCSPEIITGCAPRIVFPNVFTPNKDNMNENFVPVSYEGITHASLQMYNRWGEEVFYTDELLLGWNGYGKNYSCPAGVYFWISEYTTCTGEKLVAKGFVTLLR
jgi:gliding motility-associated-like protein